MWAVVFCTTLTLGTSPSRGQTVGDGCSINVNDALPKNGPLMLMNGVNKQSLALPIAGQVRMSKGEELVLACTGNRNKLERFGTNITSVETICEGGGNDFLTVNKSSYSAKDLGCSKAVTGEIRSTGRTCGRRGAETLELGFQVTQQWYPVVVVIHERRRGVSLFSRHTLHGEELIGGEKQMANRPNFQIGGDFYPGFSPDVAYRKTVEKTSLANILGSSTLAEKLINDTYLARGHLAPDADFVLNPYQRLTYFYINTAPQWQAVNAGNWLSLEIALRKLAKSKSMDLDIITGTYGLLTLSNEKKKQKEIYLYSNETNNKLPVPKYFWKIAYNPETKQGVAFVVLNNPFVTQITLEEILCPNICTEYNWLPKSEVWRKLANGYLYCCEVNELRKKVSYIPKLVVTAVLNGPEKN